MKPNQILAAGLVVAGILLMPSHLPSCGPFFPEAVFTYREYPGADLGRYMGGQLGVIQPTYQRSYLFVAYRYLSGKPLARKEQQALLEPVQQSASGPAQWQAARSKIPGAGPGPSVNVFRRIPGSQWESYLNCPEDAFRTAARTFQQRLEAFGAAHPGLKSWIAAQDAVFSNCSQGQSIPPPPEAGLPPVLKADRAYQIAAACFYGGKLGEAEKRFREIATDPSSPWSRMAPYLVARTLIRKATLRAEPGADLATLAQAETQLRSVLGDGNLKQTHAAAAGLLDFVAARLHPRERLRELSQALADPNRARDLPQNLTDFEYLMKRSATGLEDGLVEWVSTFERSGPEALQQALAKWEESGSAPWLVASIMKIGSNNPGLPKLLAAAEKTGRDSPAYATLSYHRVRLLMEGGEKDRARRVLDGLLPDLRASLPRSSLNLFLAQRMALAQNLEEFLQFAQRVPASMSYEGEGIDERPVKDEALFDADSVRILNQGLPLSSFERAATSRVAPVHLRRQLVMVAWTRSILLEDHQTAQALTADLEKHYPALKPFLQEYSSATNTEANRFAAAYLFLKFPGMKPYLNSGVGMRTRLEGIDNLRDNWWCSFNLEEDLDRPAFLRYNASSDARKSKEMAPAFAAFLSGPERERFRQEWRRLFELDTAPNYLSGIVISWARKNPRDPRVPEALHLAVKSTRYGCTDKETGRYSKEAFTLLHKNYPESQWATSTQYWFK